MILRNRRFISAVTQKKLLILLTNMINIMIKYIMNYYIGIDIIPLIDIKDKLKCEYKIEVKLKYNITNTQPK